MLSSHARLLAAAAAAAVVWVAFEHRGWPLAAALLALLGGTTIGILWLRAGRRRDGGELHDPAISTLVFPPESKFQQSVLPPR